MNRTRMWLVLATAAWFALPALAAPAPTPPSEGPISDALALRGILPRTAPPTVTPAVMADKSVIELESSVMVPVSKEVTETIALPNGQQQQVKRVITETVRETRTVSIKTDAIKFFIVSREGKLEAIDAAKAAGMLKQKTPVLTGDSADVDPRNLELVKAGTIYLVLPPPQPDLVPPPLPPGAKQ